VTTAEHDLLRDYVNGGKLLQLATLTPAGTPTMCNVWYAPAWEPDRLYFTSRHDRLHSTQLRANASVAGAIVAIPLEGLGQKVRGVTFTARATELPPGDLTTPLAVFLNRWPAAANSLSAELIESGQTPSRLYELHVTEWVLFDEIHYPEQPRRVIGPR
jgi:hypothetical protein